jgi:spore coat polysaccharide biosynthesis protein SpsF
MANIDFTITPKTLIILQARTGSSRLPNKVMRPLHGIPLLTHCIARLREVAPVLVATSNEKRDDPVKALAAQEQIRCFRGSEEDVLDRYYKAAQELQADYIIRATGDNPLVDIEEACRVRDLIIAGEVDYVTGAEVIDGQGLPIGVGVEAFSYEALERSWNEGHAEHHREHVNEYILGNPDAFTIQGLKCLKKNSCPGLRLTVDTEEDFLFVERITASIGKPPKKISTWEIIKWWKNTTAK